MRKKLIYVMILVFLGIFAGCTTKEKIYPYMNETTEIEIIEIVQVNENEDVYSPDLQTRLVVIEEKELFLEELSAIKFEHVFGYAYGIADGATAIKLIYSNDDYELITAVGSARYRASDNDYTHNAGTYTCSSAEFNKLIQKYLP